jgi:hypothetical protein
MGAPRALARGAAPEWLAPPLGRVPAEVSGIPRGLRPEAPQPKGVF